MPPTRTLGIVAHSVEGAALCFTTACHHAGSALGALRRLEQLIQDLRSSSEGSSAEPVRVFAIAYGGDADIESLRRIAEATNAQVYDASDATTISQVFEAVVSNF